MKTRTVLLVALGVSLPLGMAAPGWEATREDSLCPRGPAQVFPPGSVTEIEERKPPCRIEFRKTGVRLEGSLEGASADPGPIVVMDGRGRFYSAGAPGWGSVITVWDRDGSHLRSFGRRGQGPGELGGVMALDTDGKNNLNVHHSGKILGRWSWTVFSPNHQFLHDVPAAGFEGPVVILGDGTPLVSGWDRNRKNYFHTMDSTFAPSRAFGPVPDDVARAPGLLHRPISYAGGGAFWAAPLGEDAEAYILEEWGIDGELRRSLRRSFAGDPWRASAPRVVRIHLNDEGLLYAIVRRPSEEYSEAMKEASKRARKLMAEANALGYEEGREKAAAAQEARDAVRRDKLDFVVEVIDTRSGELLASEIFRLGKALEAGLPRSLFELYGQRPLFRGTTLGYRYEERPDGLPFVEIIEVVLSAR